MKVFGKQFGRFCAVIQEVLSHLEAVVVRLVVFALLLGGLTKIVFGK